MFPQPSLIADMARSGQIVPLSGDVQAAVSANYLDGVAGLGAVDGEPVAVVYRLNVKSLVWYPPADFAEHGIRFPRRGTRRWC